MLVNRYTVYFTTIHSMNPTVAEQHSGSVIFLPSFYVLPLSYEGGSVRMIQD